MAFEERPFHTPGVGNSSCPCQADVLNHDDRVSRSGSVRELRDIFQGTCLSTGGGVGVSCCVLTEFGIVLRHVNDQGMAEQRYQ